LVEASSRHLTPEYAVHGELMTEGIASGRLEVHLLSHPHRDRGIFESTTVNFDPRSARVPAKLVAPLILPSAVRGAARVAKNFGADVVYSSQDRRDVVLAAALARRIGVPHVIHLHYTFGDALGPMARGITKRADHVFAVSEFVRQSAILGGVDEQRVSTTPNTVVAASRPRPDRQVMRRSLGVSDEDVLVVAVGRLDPWKGVGDVVKAVAALRDHGLSCRLVVCGVPGQSVGHDIELETMSASLGVTEFVDFLGFRDDVPDILSAADIFSLPSVMEPFGLVYLEAMQASLPVVALRSGAVPEIVSDGATGLLAYPGDHRAFVGNLKMLVSDRELRLDMGAAGRQRLEQTFDTGAVFARWVQELSASVRS